MTLFDRFLLRKNRNRAFKSFARSNFIHHKTAQIIAQNIIDYKRNFATALEIGAKDGYLGKKIIGLKIAQNLIQSDCSEKMVFHNNLNLVMEDELDCLKDNSFDLILSNLNLHLINDIEGHLRQVKNLLKPDGLMVYSFFGEENLKELQTVLLKTEQKFYGGITPRMAPNIDIKSAGMLLAKVGFVKSVAQKYSFEVNYQNPKRLFKDLKNMAEGNVLNLRSRKFITKNFLLDLTKLYQELFVQKNEQSLATFEIIILSGWKK